MRAAILLLCTIAGILAACPYSAPGLKNWNDASSWAGGVPTVNASVIIPPGTKILLQTSPPPLTSITVQGDLIFADANVSYSDP